MTLVLGSASANVLRTTHCADCNDTNTYVTTLIEPARQNKHVVSCDFDDAMWTKLALAGVTDNAVLGVDGITSNGQKIVEDGTTAAHGVSKNLATYGLTDNLYQMESYILAPAEREWVYIQCTDLANNTRRTWFDLANVAVGTIGTGHIPYIRPLDNDWVFCYLIWPTNTGATTPATRLVMATGNNNQTYAGDGTSGIYAAWADHQLNLTSPHPTMPILTSGAAVTRPADITYVPYSRGPQETTFLFTFVEQGTITRTNGTIGYIGNAGNTGVRLWVESTGTYYRAVLHNGTTSVSSTLATAPVIDDLVELLVWVEYSGTDATVQISQSVNGGATSTAAASSAIDMSGISTYSDQRFYLGCKGASGATATESGCLAVCHMATGEEAVIDASGINSLTAMRASRGSLVAL